jgi:Rrf2 family protein
MRISTKGRYSLEALLYLALLPEGEKASTKDIAEHTGISDAYLEQLFIPLKDAGLLRGIRGPQGGYLTAKAAEKISVGDILRAVEGPLEPVACAAHDKLCAREKKCLSRSAWKELYKAISACVDSVTLADLCAAYNSLDNPGYGL